MFGKRSVPTETLGTSRATGGVISGDGAGTFDAPERDLNLVGQRRFDEYDRLVRDVAIIGAGLAGTSAALGFLDAGFDVTLYSDRDRESLRDKVPPTGVGVLFGKSREWDAEIIEDLYEVSNTTGISASPWLRRRTTSLLAPIALHWALNATGAIGAAVAWQVS